jgi:hypothetical protein
VVDQVRASAQLLAAVDGWVGGGSRVIVYLSCFLSFFSCLVLVAVIVMHLPPSVWFLSIHMLNFLFSSTHSVGFMFTYTVRLH